MDSLFKITVSVDETRYKAAVDKIIALGTTADTVSEKFVSLGTVGTQTFQKIGTEISAVTKRLIGQRQSVEALIKSYQRLASVSGKASAISPSKPVFPHELYGIPNLKSQMSQISINDVKKASQGYDWRWSALNPYTSTANRKITKQMLEQIFPNQTIESIRRPGSVGGFDIGFGNYNLPIFGYNSQENFMKQYKGSSGSGAVFNQYSRAGKIFGQEIGVTRSPENLFHEVGHFVTNQFLTQEEIQAIYSRALKSISKGTFWKKPNVLVEDIGEVTADYFAGMTSHAFNNPMFMQYLKQNQSLQDPVHRVFQEMFTGKLWQRPRDIDLKSQSTKIGKAFNKIIDEEWDVLKKAGYAAEKKEIEFREFAKGKYKGKEPTTDELYNIVDVYQREQFKTTSQYSQLPTDSILREAMKKAEAARAAQGIDTEEMRRRYEQAARENQLGTTMERVGKQVVTPTPIKSVTDEKQMAIDEDFRRNKIIKSYERQMQIEKEIAKTKAQQRKVEVAELTGQGRTITEIDKLDDFNQRYKAIGDYQTKLETGIDQLSRKYGVSSKIIEKDIAQIEKRWKTTDAAIQEYDKHQESLVKKATAYKEFNKPLDQQTFQTQQKMQALIDQGIGPMQKEWEQQQEAQAVQEELLRKARQPKWLTQRQQQVVDIEKGLKETLDRGMMGYTQEKQHAVLSKRAQALREEMEGFTGKRSEFAAKHGAVLKGLTKDYDNFNNSIGNTNRTMGGGLGFWEKWGMRMSGVAATLFVWQEILQRIRAVVAMARQYEDAIRQTAAQTGTQAFMPQYEKKFEETMLGTGQPVDKIAEATQALMDLGLSPKEALDRLGDTLEIAKNKSIKMADAAQIAAFNTWGLRDAILEANKVVETGGERAWGQFTNQLQLIAKEFTREFEPAFIEQMEGLSIWVRENKDDIIAGFTAIVKILGLMALGVAQVVKGLGMLWMLPGIGPGFYEKLFKGMRDKDDFEKNFMPQEKIKKTLEDRKKLIETEIEGLQTGLETSVGMDIGVIIDSDATTSQIETLKKELSGVNTELEKISKQKSIESIFPKNLSMSQVKNFRKELEDRREIIKQDILKTQEALTGQITAPGGRTVQDPYGFTTRQFGIPQVDEAAKKISDYGKQLDTVNEGLKELDEIGKKAVATLNEVDPKKIAAAWQSMWTLLNQTGPKMEIDVGINIPGITDDGRMVVEQGLQERVKQMVQQYRTNMRVEGIGEEGARKMMEQQMFQLYNVELKAPSQKAYGELFGMAGVAPKDYWATQKSQMANELKNAPIDEKDKVSIMSFFNFEIDQKRLAPIMASWKEVLDKLGSMGQPYYQNELAKIEHERIKMIGQGIDKEYANRLANQAKIALEWEKKIADETKVTPEQRKHFETMFQETKMYPDRFREYERMIISMTAGKIKQYTGDEEGAAYYEEKKVFEQTYEKMAAKRVEIGEAMYNELGILEESYYDLLKRKAEDRERLLVKGGMDPTRAAEIRAKEELDLEEKKNKNILDAWQQLQEKLGFVSNDYLAMQENRYKQMATRLKNLLPESEQGNIQKLVDIARLDDQARAIREAANAYRDLEQGGVMVPEQFRLEHEALNKELEKWIKLIDDAEQAQVAFNRAFAQLDVRQYQLSQKAIDGVQLRLAQAALETKTVAEDVASRIGSLTGSFEYGVQEGIINVINRDFKNAAQSMVDIWKDALDRMAADIISRQLGNLLFGQLMPTPGSQYNPQQGIGGLLGKAIGIFTGGTAGVDKEILGQNEGKIDRGGVVESIGEAVSDSIAEVIVPQKEVDETRFLKNFVQGFSDSIKDMSMNNMMVNTLYANSIVGASGTGGSEAGGLIGSLGGLVGGLFGSGDTGMGTNTVFSGGETVGDFLGKVRGFATGGLITEPVFGVGIHSGVPYSFGEKGVERVTPGSGDALSGTNNIVINVQAPQGRVDRESMTALQTALHNTLQRVGRRNA